MLENRAYYPLPEIPQEYRNTLWESFLASVPGSVINSLREVNRGQQLTGDNNLGCPYFLYPTTLSVEDLEVTSNQSLLLLEYMISGRVEEIFRRFPYIHALGLGNAGTIINGRYVGIGIQLFSPRIDRGSGSMRVIADGTRTHVHWF